MIISLPRCLEFDFNQQICAQQSWEAACVTCLIPLYTLFLPLYSLWQYSYQFCSCCKKVLRSAEVLVASLGVTSSWGSNYQAVVDAKRVDTVQGLWLLFHLLHYYITYNIHYSHYMNKRIRNLAWHSLTKRCPKQPTWSERSVSSKREQIGLSCWAAAAPLLSASWKQTRFIIISIRQIWQK